MVSFLLLPSFYGCTHADGKNIYDEHMACSHLLPLMLDPLSLRSLFGMTILVDRTKLWPLCHPVLQLSSNYFACCCDHLRRSRLTIYWWRARSRRYNKINLSSDDFRSPQLCNFGHSSMMNSRRAHKVGSVSREFPYHPSKRICFCFYFSLWSHDHVFYTFSYSLAFILR